MIPWVSLCSGIQMEIPAPFSLNYALAAHHESVALPWSKVDFGSGSVFATNCHGFCKDSSQVCDSCECLQYSSEFKCFVDRSKWTKSDLAGRKGHTKDAFLSHNQMKWKNETKREAAQSSRLTMLNANKKITRLSQAQSFHNHVLLLISQNKIRRSVCSFPWRVS